MATTINSGVRPVVFNVNVGTSDTPVDLGTEFSFFNTLIIKCRTAIAMQLRVASGASEYYTIAANTVLEIRLKPRVQIPLYLKADSEVVAEIIGIKE